MLRTCAVVPYVGFEGLWEGPELDFVNKFNTLQLGHETIGKMVKVLEDAMYGIERNGNPKIILMDATYGLVKAIMKKKLGGQTTQRDLKSSLGEIWIMLTWNDTSTGAQRTSIVARLYRGRPQSAARVVQPICSLGICHLSSLHGQFR